MTSCHDFLRPLTDPTGYKLSFMGLLLDEQFRLAEALWRNGKCAADFTAEGTDAEVVGQTSWGKIRWNLATSDHQWTLVKEEVPREIGGETVTTIVQRVPDSFATCYERDDPRGKNLEYLTEVDILSLADGLLVEFIDCLIKTEGRRTERELPATDSQSASV